MTRLAAPVDVSIIIAVRNGAETLAQCIDSILRQEDCRVELIVVDALSDDGTEEIIRSYGDVVTHYIREADTGIYDAWNKALRVATGEWCAFLGADDQFASESSLASLLHVARLPGAKPYFVFGSVRFFDGSEPLLNMHEVPDLVSHLRRGKMIAHVGSLHRREGLEMLGGFDATYKVLGDWPMVLGLARLGEARQALVIVANVGLDGVSNSAAMQEVVAEEWMRFLREERGLMVAYMLKATYSIKRMLSLRLESGLSRVLGGDLGDQVFERLVRLLRR